MQEEGPRILGRAPATRRNGGASRSHLCAAAHRVALLSEVTQPLGSPQCLHPLRSDMVAAFLGGLEWGILVT